jgi:hypothetical protein
VRAFLFQLLLRSKTASKSERARAPVVQACPRFERSRNTLRRATGKNEVSVHLTEVAGDWASRKWLN